MTWSAILLNPLKSFHLSSFGQHHVILALHGAIAAAPFFSITEKKRKQEVQFAHTSCSAALMITFRGPFVATWRESWRDEEALVAHQPLVP